jgi:hypothetical protein
LLQPQFGIWKVILGRLVEIQDHRLPKILPANQLGCFAHWLSGPGIFRRIPFVVIERRLIAPTVIYQQAFSIC